MHRHASLLAQRGFGVWHFLVFYIPTFYLKIMIIMSYPYLIYFIPTPMILLMYTLNLECVKRKGRLGKCIKMINET